MRSIHKLVFCLTYIAFSLNAQPNKHNTFYVKGRKIYTSKGEEVILRGVNEMMIWSSDPKGFKILPEIAKTGSNAVRLVWTIDGAPADLDTLIGNCIKNKMIAIPELHNATGDFGKLQACVDYWKNPEVIKLMNKHKKWVLLNIANEVGAGSETDEQYLEYYRGAIRQLRQMGYEMPLIIDAGGWGNNERYIINNADALSKCDSLQNIIFSIHTYWTGPNQESRFDNLANTMRSKNLPLIIGEGPQKAASPISCESPFPYRYIINKCQEMGIGWLSWSWGAVNNNDCGAPDSIFDMTSDGTCLGLNEFGKEICLVGKNSIKKTSKRPRSILRVKTSR